MASGEFLLSTIQGPTLVEANSEIAEHYGDGTHDLYVYRDGSFVFLNGILKPTVAISGGARVTLGTIPAGFRPKGNPGFMISIPNIGTGWFEIGITTMGLIRFNPGGQTIPVGTKISFGNVFCVQF